MRDTEPPQLRITQILAWPESPLPIPAVGRVPSHLDATGTVIVPESPTVALSPELHPGSGETYLSLVYGLDLDDADAILAFVNSFGVLGGSAAYRNATDDVLGRRFFGHRLRPGTEDRRRERAWRSETESTNASQTSLDAWRLRHASTLNNSL